MKAQIVSFHCVLRNQIGHLISSTFNQDVITRVEGGSNSLPGLAENLQDLREGEKRRIVLKAERAYGFYDPRLVVEVSPRKLRTSGAIQCGDHISLEPEDGGAARLYEVTRVTHDLITLDANHPLAGQDLVFDIEATAARDATPEEIAEARVEATDPCSRLH